MLLWSPGWKGSLLPWRPSMLVPYFWASLLCYLMVTDLFSNEFCSCLFPLIDQLHHGPGLFFQFLCLPWYPAVSYHKQTHKKYLLNDWIHLNIQQIFSGHLLCARYYSRHRGEQQWGMKIILLPSTSLHSGEGLWALLTCVHKDTKRLFCSTQNIQSQMLL